MWIEFFWGKKWGNHSKSKQNTLSCQYWLIFKTASENELGEVPQETSYLQLTKSQILNTLNEEDM